MTKRYFIGLSSGNSHFGVDAVLVRAEKGAGDSMAFALEHSHYAPHGRELRDLLLRVTHSSAPELRYLGTLHRVLGETYALAVKPLLDKNRLIAQQALCIGCSGQSLWHDPDGRYPAALDLGMAGVLAERTGLTTLTGFAERDLALGGQGAPLTAIVDAMRFHHPDENRLHLHLGSTATAVWMPADLGIGMRNVIGFEASPCTMLLDGVMRVLSNGREQYDAGGKHAVQGRRLDPLLDRWMQNHFLHARPPKCVPRAEFADDFIQRAVEQAKRIGGSQHDVLCTMTHFVAHAIVQAVNTLLPTKPTRILLSGRGVRNGFLWRLLEEQLAPMPLETTDAHGIQAEACKAMAYAGLAALALDGIPINLPTVTGASGQRLLGQWSPGSTSNWARCLAWMSRQNAPLQAAA